MDTGAELGIPPPCVVAPRVFTTLHCHALRHPCVVTPRVIPTLYCYALRHPVRAQWGSFADHSLLRYILPCSRPIVTFANDCHASQLVLCMQVAQPTTSAAGKQNQRSSLSDVTGRSANGGTTNGFTCLDCVDGAREKLGRVGSR